MMLLVALCVEEYAEDIAVIFQKAGITIFSKTNATGFKTNEAVNLADEWFGAANESLTSVVYFSFTDAEKAASFAKLAAEYNAGGATFPTRVFSLPATALV